MQSVAMRYFMLTNIIMLAVACSKDDKSSTRNQAKATACSQGASQPCQCDNGQPSNKTCSADGRWHQCACPTTENASASSAVASSARATAGASKVLSEDFETMEETIVYSWHAGGQEVPITFRRDDQTLSVEVTGKTLAEKKIDVGMRADFSVKPIGPDKVGISVTSVETDADGVMKTLHFGLELTYKSDGSITATMLPYTSKASWIKYY